MTIIAKTLLGLEGLLEQELIELGAKEVVRLNRGVQCTYDKELLYKINIESRYCLRVLIAVEQFTAKNPDELHQAAMRIPWENYLDVRQTFAIGSSVFSTYFKHSQYASLKLKDAICDRFRKLKNSRPSINTDNPDVWLNLHIKDDAVTVSLDSSGESLHKRGYKQFQDIAPINEVLAAGLIGLTGWNKQDIFVDGMCGSGTIAIEAALMAINKAPNIDRENFCFKNWQDFDRQLYDKIIEAANAKIINKKETVIAVDFDEKVLQKAQRNINRARLRHQIELQKRNFLKFIPPHQKGVCILNPPYNERMEQDEIDVFYKEIGDAFKQHFTLYTCGIISSNIDAMKKIGLKPKQRIDLMNGKLPCKFNVYEMY
jgi:putative N6-adenine-specific DNA methylase